MEVNVEAIAVSIYCLIYKLMSSGSQQIFWADDNEDEETEGHICSYSFLWTIGFFFCEDFIDKFQNVMAYF